MGKPQVLIVGGGMITHDQILPSLYHLQRLGQVGSIRICALNSPPLRALAESAGLEVELIAGGYDLEPLGPHDDRLILLARKPGPAA